MEIKKVNLPNVLQYITFAFGGLVENCCWCKIIINESKVQTISMTQNKTDKHPQTSYGWELLRKNNKSKKPNSNSVHNICLCARIYKAINKKCIKDFKKVHVHVHVFIKTLQTCT